MKEAPQPEERRGAEIKQTRLHHVGPERLFGLELVAVKAARQKSPGNHTRPVLLEVDPV